MKRTTQITDSGIHTQNRPGVGSGQNQAPDGDGDGKHDSNTSAVRGTLNRSVVEDAQSQKHAPLTQTQTQKSQNDTLHKMPLIQEIKPRLSDSESKHTRVESAGGDKQRTQTQASGSRSDSESGNVHNNTKTDAQVNGMGAATMVDQDDTRAKRMYDVGGGLDDLD